MGNCEHCENCGGCVPSLELTEPELSLLDLLSQVAFLPVFRRADDMTPILDLEGPYTQAEYSLILQLLEQKRLVSLDYGKALAPAPKEYPVGGSVGLTQRGQTVIDQIQTQGIQ